MIGGKDSGKEVKAAEASSSIAVSAPETVVVKPKSEPLDELLAMGSTKTGAYILFDRRVKTNIE